jgi:hypothetical protein
LHLGGKTKKIYFARENLKNFFIGGKAKHGYFAGGKDLLTLIIIVSILNNF